MPSSRSGFRASPLYTCACVLGLVGARAALGGVPSIEIVPPNSNANDRFGDAVAISGDRMVVGSVEGGAVNNRGAIRIYQWTGSEWLEEAMLTGSDTTPGDEFGRSLAMDGDTIVVGARRDNPFYFGAAYVFVYANGFWQEQTKLEASDRDIDDFFGWSVDVSGDTIVVGAYGVNAAYTDVGAAYVFTRSAGIWTEQVKIEPTDGIGIDRFGHSVSVSEDTLAVGAILGEGPTNVAQGAVYVYTGSGAAWMLQQKLAASDGADGDFFGAGVGVQGDTLLVGAFGDDDYGIESGSAYIFTRSGGVWTEGDKLHADDGQAGDSFGAAVSLDGDVVLVGAPGDDSDTVADVGSAHLFVREGANWSGLAKLTADGDPGSNFGDSVGASGNRFVVGMPFRDSGYNNNGAAYVFERQPVAAPAPPSLELLASFAANDRTFGWSVAIEGDTALIGAPGDGDNGASAGAAYVFRWDGSAWVEEAKLLANDGAPVDFFGRSVALAGDVALVGSPFDDNPGSTDSGTVYVFRRSLGVWSQAQKIHASDRASSDFFGSTIAASGNFVIIGAEGDEEFTGSAYIFRRSGAAWVQQAKLTASDAATYDRFGSAVSISGDTALVGAFGNTDAGPQSGSAYVFTRSGSFWAQEAKLVDSIGATEDYFGFTVAISGDDALIGAYGADTNGPDSGTVVAFTRSGAVWSEVAHLQSDDASTGDIFGASVAIRDGVAIVGAVGDDAAGQDVGAAYLFVNESGTWVQRRRLLPSDPGDTDLFGFNVAMSGENVLVTAPLHDDGAIDNGSAYLFERTGPQWVGPSQKTFSPFVAAGHGIGYVVAIDGDTALVGASGAPGSLGEGASYVFTREGGEWLYQSTMDAGYAVDVSGDLAVVGAPLSDVLLPDHGRALMYGRTGSVWTLLGSTSGDLGTAQAGDQFGHSVGVSDSHFVIGAPFSNPGGYADRGSATVYFYSAIPPHVQFQVVLTASDAQANQNFARAVAISGNRIVVGAPSDNEAGGEAGAAYVFTLVGGVWQQTAKLFVVEDGADDLFGRSVAIDGDTIVVGANQDDDMGPNAGAAYVFRYNGIGWTLEGKIMDPNGSMNESFGRTVSVSGDCVVVGSINDTVNGNANQGSVHLFRRNGDQWLYETTVSDPAGAASDFFGNAVAVSGETVLVGALGDDSMGNFAGAAHFFETNTVTNPNATVRDLPGGTTSQSFANAVSAAGPTSQLSGAYASFQAGDWVDFVGKALAVESAAEIRQPWAAYWTLADGASLATPSGRDIEFFGTLVVPASASVSVTADALRFGAASTLTGGAGATLMIDGDLDIAISDPARFSFSQGAIVVTGESSIEAMSGGGGGGARSLTDFNIQSLTVAGGAGATIVDNHDNDDDNTDPESIVVTNLVIESGATLNTNGRTVFYENLTNNGSVDDAGNLVDLSPCPADLTGDNSVGGADLAILLAAWGSPNSPADLTGDNTVSGADLAILLAAWGACN